MYKTELFTLITYLYRHVYSIKVKYFFDHIKKENFPNAFV